MNRRKMSSKERQELIVDTLKQAKHPVTGSEFAKIANVSRQVIVQDVSLLKAKGEEIIATSQGYIYTGPNKDQAFQKVIVCQHNAEQAKKELYIIVDHGVTVKDVIVEHPVYGHLTAAIRVSNRMEVNQFLDKINATNAAFLSSLTEGLHLHTIEADCMEKLEAVSKELEKEGILIPQTS